MVYRHSYWLTSIVRDIELLYPITYNKKIKSNIIAGIPIPVIDVMIKTKYINHEALPIALGGGKEIAEVFNN